MTTTRVDDTRTGHSTFTFEIDNMKFKDLKVILDFSGSSNLLLDTGTISTRCNVAPYERRIVGVLRTITVTNGWSLKQKVSVEQNEPDIPAASHSAPAIPRRVQATPIPTNTNMSARERVMAASKNTAFYRRASLDRGGGGGDSTPPVLALLESIQMKQYWPLFLSEAMDDINMLLTMAKDKGSFRSAMKEMGISRMGHREAILNALALM
jgi:hypothetical protein